MPYSLPPDEGPVPYEGQDLDGLLSGGNCDVPDELLKVIPALDALRATARGTELLGEFAVRAEFRKFMLTGETGSAIPAAGARDPRTLTLPPAAAAVGAAHVVRHRPHSHRRPPRRGRWQAKALVGVAAAAVVAVGATALAATLSSPSAGPTASRLTSGMTSSAPAPSASGSYAVDGSGTPEPTAKPTHASAQPSVDNPSPVQLCNEYFASLADPRRHGNSQTESELFQMLSSLAKGPGGVPYYCGRLELWEIRQGRGTGPFTSNGEGQPGAQWGQGTQLAGGAAGGGGNGNDQGRNGPGPGGQGQP